MFHSLLNSIIAPILLCSNLPMEVKQFLLHLLSGQFPSDPLLWQEPCIRRNRYTIDRVDGIRSFEGHKPFMEILFYFVSLHIVIAERDRQRTGGPVSFQPRIFICSKIVVTVVNLIPHKPRFHAGLRAVRQSNGFIVGNKSAIWHNSTYPFTAIIAQLQSRPSVFGTLHNSAYLVVSLS